MKCVHVKTSSIRPVVSIQYPLSDKQTDGHHMTTANAALALRRPVKMHVLNINATPSTVLAFLPRTCTADFKTKCNSLTN